MPLREQPWAAGNIGCLVQEAGLAGVELEFVAVGGVSDGDQTAGSFVQAGSAQRGDAVFGDDVIDGVFRRPRNHSFGGEL